LKNELLKFLSVNNIVIPAAKTGNESNNKNAVKKTAHTKSGIIFIRNPGVRIFKTVAIKFIAPINEEIPAKCRLKIAKSTDPSEAIALNGG